MTIRMTFTRPTVAVLILLLIATPILAQAIKGFNSNAPLDYDADKIEVQDATGHIFLTGNVHIRQPGFDLRAQRITATFSKPNGGIQVNRVDAEGGVSATTPTQAAHGDAAIYDLDRKLITVVGGVDLQQGNDTLHGGRLVMDLNTGRSVVDGSAAGAVSNDPNSATGRVSGHFTVPQRKP